LQVVDDERSIRLSNQRLLSRLGCDVELASDGEHVVPELARAAAAGRPYDAVMLDVVMRRTHGDAACAHARAHGFAGLPIFAATGNATPADVANYATSGFTAVIAKPFTSDAVKTAFRQAHVLQ
jgi:CheY-like chemotaxis protein